MKQGGYLDGVKKRLPSTGGILATITTMGNMFLHLRQVIDFRVQKGSRQVGKLWNVGVIVSINVMNKISWFIARQQATCPLVTLTTGQSLPTIFRTRWPRSDLGGNISDAPAAVGRGLKRVDCLVRGAEDHLWQRSWGPDQLQVTNDPNRTGGVNGGVLDPDPN